MFKIAQFANTLAGLTYTTGPGAVPTEPDGTTTDSYIPPDDDLTIKVIELRDETRRTAAVTLLKGALPENMRFLSDHFGKGLVDSWVSDPSRWFVNIALDSWFFWGVDGDSVAKTLTRISAGEVSQIVNKMPDAGLKMRALTDIIRIFSTPFFIEEFPDRSFLIELCKRARIETAYKALITLLEVPGVQLSYDEILDLAGSGLINHDIFGDVLDVSKRSNLRPVEFNAVFDVFTALARGVKGEITRTIAVLGFSGEEGHLLTDKFAAMIESTGLPGAASGIVRFLTLRQTDVVQALGIVARDSVEAIPIVLDNFKDLMTAAKEMGISLTYAEADRLSHIPFPYLEGAGSITGPHLQTLGAVSPRDAVDSTLKTWRLLDSYFPDFRSSLDLHLLNDGGLSDFTRHITSISIGKDIDMVLRMGIYESTNGLDFELDFRWRKLATLGFVWTEDAINIVKLQGGRDIAGLGEYKEFLEFSGGVEPKAWLGFTVGRYLLGKALVLGESFRFLGGENLYWSYHIPQMHDGTTSGAQWRAEYINNFDQAANLFGNLADALEELMNQKENREWLLTYETKCTIEGLRELSSRKVRDKIAQIQDSYNMTASMFGFRRFNEWYEYTDDPSRFGARIQRRAKSQNRFLKSVAATDTAVARESYGTVTSPNPFTMFEPLPSQLRADRLRLRTGTHGNENGREQKGAGEVRVAAGRSFIERGPPTAGTAETPAEARLRETCNRPVEFLEAVREFMEGELDGCRPDDEELMGRLGRGERSLRDKILRTTGMREAELEGIIERLPNRGRPSSERPDARTEEREERPEARKPGRPPIGK